MPSYARQHIPRTPPHSHALETLRTTHTTQTTSSKRTAEIIGQFGQYGRGGGGHCEYPIMIGRDGKHPLISEAVYGSVDMERLLHDSCIRATINVQERYSRTALNYVEPQRESLRKISDPNMHPPQSLLKAEANPNIPDNNRLTHLAYFGQSIVRHICTRPARSSQILAIYNIMGTAGPKAYNAMEDEERILNVHLLIQGGENPTITDIRGSGSCGGSIRLSRAPRSCHPMQTELGA